jgi:hypothetical protein
MSEAKNQMRDVLQELYTCGCSVIDALDDSDLIDADSVERFEDALHEAKAALSHPAPDVPEPTFPDIEEHEYTFGPGRKAPGAEEVEAIRARHEYAEQKSGDLYTPEYCEWTFSQTHRDRATLLRLLDAAREELRAVKEAAGPFVEAASHHSADTSDSYCIENMYPGLTLGELRRLASALKEPQQ